MDKSNLRHIHDPVLLPLKVEVICFFYHSPRQYNGGSFVKSVCLRLASVLVGSFVPCPSMFIASTRPHTCISSGCQGYRLVLRRLHVASYTCGYGMRWRHESAVTVTRSHGIRRLRHIHVNVRYHHCFYIYSHRMNIYITYFSQIALAKTATTRRNISELQAVVAAT